MTLGEVSVLHFLQHQVAEEGGQPLLRHYMLLLGMGWRIAVVPLAVPSEPLSPGSPLCMDAELCGPGGLPAFLEQPICPPAQKVLFLGLESHFEIPLSKCCGGWAQRAEKTYTANNLEL